jgi:hypothetical protein
MNVRQNGQGEAQHMKLGGHQVHDSGGSYAVHIVKAELKAMPLQACCGPEGSRKLRFSDFMTTAQDGVKVVSLAHRPPLPPGNTRGTHFC